MQTENEFNKTLKESLELFEYHKTILWFERLNSGKVQSVNMGWVQLCRKGTPDWVVIFYDRNKHLSILFIEGKSDSGMSINRESQNIFAEKYTAFKIIRTNSFEEVKNYINDNSFDKMKAWSKEVDQLNIGLTKVISEEEMEESI